MGEEVGHLPGGQRGRTQLTEPGERNPHGVPTTNCSSTRTSPS
jgi:hypothetical protein